MPLEGTKIPPSPLMFGSRSRSSPALSHSLQAVGGGAIPQGAHPLHLQRRGGDQHLAADVVADAVLLAKGFGGAVAGEAKLRLEAAGRVVHPGVDHAAVMAGLMAGRAGLFFQQRNAGVRVNLN